MKCLRQWRSSAALGVMWGGLMWAGLWGGLLTPPASANTVTFGFSGNLSNVSNDLFPSFNTGQTLTGFYSFDSTTPDSNPSANRGQYNGTISSLTVTVGSYTATLGTLGDNFIQVRNLPNNNDRYEVRAPLTGPSLVNAGDTFTPVRFRIELKDGNAFSSDTLPTTPPSLSSFAQNQFRIVFTDGHGNDRIKGSLTSLVAVPLPASILLFGAGLIALVGLGAGSWRQRQAQHS